MSSFCCIFVRSLNNGDSRINSGAISIAKTEFLKEVDRRNSDLFIWKVLHMDIFGIGRDKKRSR